MKLFCYLGSLAVAIACTACYANFRTENYRASHEVLPRIDGLELDIEIRQAEPRTPGLIYRDDGPYRVRLRLSEERGMHSSVTVHRLVVRDCTTGESWTIVVPSSPPVVFPFVVQEEAIGGYRAEMLSEKEFDPEFREDKSLEAEIDLSVRRKGKADVRRTTKIRFKAHGHEVKGFLGWEALMGV